MTDPSAAAAQAYRSVQVLTASPAEALLLSFDTAIDQCARAGEAAGVGDRDSARASEAKVTQVILLLMTAINPTPDPILAERLFTLYRWCLARLAESRQSDGDVYTRVRAVLSGLRHAFAEAASAAKESSHA